jgi:hypothetical protein
MVVGRITFGPVAAGPSPARLLPPAARKTTVRGSLTGVVGRIDWGYFVAGAINNYSVQRVADGSWTLKGTLVNHNSFNIRQRNLIFVAPHKHGEWRWPIKTIDVGDGPGPREMRATLGPQLPNVRKGS